MRLIFEDRLVSERFVSLVDKDRHVEQPGTYSGLFSKITPAMAYMMVRKGATHLIAFKEGFKDDDQVNTPIDNNQPNPAAEE